VSYSSGTVATTVTLGVSHARARIIAHSRNNLRTPGISPRRKNGQIIRVRFFYSFAAGRVHTNNIHCLRRFGPGRNLRRYSTSFQTSQKSLIPKMNLPLTIHTSGAVVASVVKVSTDTFTSTSVSSPAILLRRSLVQKSLSAYHLRPL
jgi:hypothetical protein